MRYLAAGALLMACVGCQAVPALITVGLEVVVKATELDTALIENIRASTGACVGVDLRQKPCPTTPTVTPPPIVSP